MQDPVLILGASGGLGSAIARRLSRAGMPVLLHGRRADRLESVARSLPAGAASSIECFDATDEAAVKAAFERIGAKHTRLAGLVFSIATAFPNRLTHRLPWSLFEEQMSGQLKALHLAATAAFPLLANPERTARCVVLSTEFVLGTPPIKTAPYVAAKAAMTAYAKVIAQEWLKRGVRVHIVAPGLVKTDLVAGMPDEYLDSLAAQMPENRLTEAHDVAEFVAFLFTDAADPLYGTTLQVSRASRR